MKVLLIDKDLPKSAVVLFCIQVSRSELIRDGGKEDNTFVKVLQCSLREDVGHLNECEGRIALVTQPALLRRLSSGTG